jgi:CspA family cold shock protein
VIGESRIRLETSTLRPNRCTSSVSETQNHRPLHGKCRAPFADGARPVIPRGQRRLRRISGCALNSLCPYLASRRKGAFARIFPSLVLNWDFVMITGTVKFFNADKGYGFIAPEGGGDDAFVHISAVERAGMNTLDKDQRVSYELEKDQRGKMSAVNLQSA